MALPNFQGARTPASLVTARATDYAAIINRARDPLIAAGVNPDFIDPGLALRRGYTDSIFAGLLRPFADAESIERIDLLFHVGITEGLFTMARSMTLEQFFGFLKFLRSPQGQESVNNAARKEKFAKRGGTARTSEEMGWIGMFEVVRTNCGNKVGDVRKEFELKIAEAELVLKDLRAESERAIVRTYDQFYPIGEYKALEVEVLNRRCWDRYCRENLVAGGEEPFLTQPNLKAAVESFADIVKGDHIVQFMQSDERRNAIKEQIYREIGVVEARHDGRSAKRFVSTWKQWAIELLVKHPQHLRQQLANKIPVGSLALCNLEPTSLKLSSILKREWLEMKRQIGHKPLPSISRRLEISLLNYAVLEDNSRVRILLPMRGGDVRAIPLARSKWEAGVRKIIGGGEMREWGVDSNMYRGGGCFADAIKLLGDASVDPPGWFLADHYTLHSARDALNLPSGLAVPDGVFATHMKNFNDDATSGPLLYAFSCKRKNLLGPALSNFMWNLYDAYGDGLLSANSLPYFAGRIGFRSKLLPYPKALDKLSKGEPLGRCVVMMDAFEQAASSPLYNVLIDEIYKTTRIPSSGFRNGVIRASTDWVFFWEEVRTAKVVVELDWKKFDRERPPQDLLFCIDVFVSCFEPKSPREIKLLEAYKICMVRALVDRAFITDTGGVFFMDGMVPSGSLWTGLLDTSLNILYMTSALLDMGFLRSEAVPKCCGDDNITLFSRDPGDDILNGLRTRLNNYFRAGIDIEDFIITRPPYYVTKEQACFPLDLDLSLGTSSYLKDAIWVPFDGEIEVDIARGRSHRWRYNFHGKPKFLSCYWLPSGLPIRPSKDNLEKLLFPEAIHTSLDDYEAAVLSMVVDNPFNHHNINHLKHRYLIIQQIKKYTVLEIDAAVVMKFSRIKGSDEEMVPFPLVAAWRRQNTYIDLDHYELVRWDVRDFDSFVHGITSLYKRDTRGGIDAYQFMNIIRGECDAGSGQWGNDLKEWLSFVRNHPCTKYLKKVRRHRKKTVEVNDLDEQAREGHRGLQVLWRRLVNEEMKSTEDYAMWVASLLNVPGFVE
ncbi:TPA_asm: fusion protein [Epipogium roseum amalgavirus 1]|nr:TPA_asm: fusion protein [Epipogium roseum amalgavirus 1]